MEILSKHTRQVFREHLVGWTLRTIADLFDAADIPRADLPRGVSYTGERRSLVEEYYAGVDWTSPQDLRKILRVYERILEDLDQKSADYLKLMNLLRRDGFRHEDGHLVSGGSVDLSKVENASEIVDRKLLREHLRRIDHTIESDPAQAIGSAKELLETVAKFVLTTYGHDPEQFDTVQRLLKEAMRCLDLTVEQIPETTRGASAIKQVLSGLAQIVGATAEIRNLYGTGHGRVRSGGMQPRHARLVVGAVATLTSFLLETLDSRKAERRS